MAETPVELPGPPDCECSLIEPNRVFLAPCSCTLLPSGANKYPGRIFLLILLSQKNSKQLGEAATFGCWDCPGATERVEAELDEGSLRHHLRRTPTEFAAS